MKHITFAIFCVIALGACKQYSKVEQIEPRWRQLSTATVVESSLHNDIVTAMENRKKQPLVALGSVLATARIAHDRLLEDPKDKVALEAYNFAVARVVGIAHNSGHTPWPQPLALATSSGPMVLSHKKDPRPQWNPALYDFVPADQFRIGGTYVKERLGKEGVGAPLVAIGKKPNTAINENFGLERTYYGVTALLHFKGNNAELTFMDPLATEDIQLGHRTFPMAADYTVPLAVMLASTEPKKLELNRLLNPAKYAYTARISRLQPYDPDKTVVLVIHGLMDSPATWTPLLNHLRADETIRRNYQFWFYSYPSGYPYPHSAAILRKELDGIEKKFPLKHEMVVIGHSMGGCISRLLITDTGETFWKKFFAKAPAQTSLSADAKKLLTDAIVFDHRPEIGRVIFVSAPLRGSNLASDWIGRLGTKLVKSPANLLQVGNNALKLVTLQSDDLHIKRMPNSVDTLAPNNRFVKEINQVPVTPGIPHHVICGDRGKGGNKDTTKPIMSDGVVPYWSSHMATAKSEKIVPSGHSAHQNPEAIIEIKRILREHAENK